MNLIQGFKYVGVEENENGTRILGRKRGTGKRIFTIAIYPGSSERFFKRRHRVKIYEQDTKISDYDIFTGTLKPYRALADKMAASTGRYAFDIRAGVDISHLEIPGYIPPEMLI